MPTNSGAEFMVLMAAHTLALLARRCLQWCVYGLMVAMFWGQPLVSFSPDYLWPSVRVHAFSSGGQPGSVGALSVVAIFRFGIAPRLSSVR